MTSKTTTHFQKTRNCKVNMIEPACVLDKLLRMSEGKEHATSLVDFIIMPMQIGSQT